MEAIVVGGSRRKAFHVRISKFIRVFIELQPPLGKVFLSQSPWRSFALKWHSKLDLEGLVTRTELTNKLFSWSMPSTLGKIFKQLHTSPNNLSDPTGIQTKLFYLFFIFRWRQIYVCIQKTASYGDFHLIRCKQRGKCQWQLNEPCGNCNLLFSKAPLTCGIGNAFPSLPATTRWGFSRFYFVRDSSCFL